MNKLTGNKDVDVLILNQLEDHELGAICQVNKYINSLCNDENFWLNRIINRINYACRSAKKIPFFKEIECDIDIISIRNMLIYFGFKTFRELSKYLSQFTKGMQLSIVKFIDNADTLDQIYYEKILKKIYKIEREKLPEYINYNKLMRFLRKEIVKVFYLEDDHDDLLRDLLPDIEGVTWKEYGINKRAPTEYELFAIN